MNYDEAYVTFDLDRALAALASGDPFGANAAAICRDRRSTALISVSRDGRHTTYPFGQFRDLSCRFANVLQNLGVEPREVEFLESLPKTPSGKIQRFILRNQ